MKTILLHVHDDRGAEARLQAACDIARATGAHIRCVQLTAMPAMMMADAFGGAALAPSVMEELEAHDASVRLRLWQAWDPLICHSWDRNTMQSAWKRPVLHAKWSPIAPSTRNVSS